MEKMFLKLGTYLFGLMALFLLLPVSSASADASHNIRGLAYNSLYGYISFNCLDDDFSGRFPFTFPFTFNILPCTLSQHGVNLDDYNNFSGDAWNSFLGTITFTSALITPDGGSFRSHCERVVATSTACYSETDEQVYGYMRVLSTGEWINLDDTLVAPTTKITNYNAASPGIFSGYASSSFGSISFNCSNDGSCATNNYDVKIGPLQIRQMTAPNWDNVDACAGGAKQAYLKWNRRSGTQSAFRIIVSTANSTSTGVVFDSGKISTPAIQYPFIPPSYDTAYYWFLMLWDQANTPTQWRQFNSDGPKDRLTNNIDRNTIVAGANHNFTFTSYRYEFPRPVFTWTPEEIVVATTTNSFVSNSIYYSGGGSQSCTSLSCSFSWTTSDALANILNSSSASTSIMFTKATNTVVTLTTSDRSDPVIYTCSSSTILNVNYALPLWKETKAPTSTP